MWDLDKILEDSNDIRSKWITNMAHPYARSYATALTEARRIREAQNKLDAQRLEFGITALTICSGGVLTHVFAQTAWRSVAANVTLDIICRNNMDRAFNIAHFVANNKAATFIVGTLWDQGGAFLGREIKSQFEQTPANFSSVQQWQTETSALTSLEDFVENCYQEYRDTARYLFNSANLSISDLNQAVGGLANSNFTKPPRSSTIDEDKVAKEIELLFHLRVVMDLDYIQNISIDREGIIPTGPRRRIEAAPGTPEYPEGTLRRIGTELSGSSIFYDDLGMAFYDRINVLHNDLYGRKLFHSSSWNQVWNATIDYRAFNDAAGAIQVLNDTGINRFQASLIGH